MASQAKVSDNGTILSWQVDDVDVLYPERQRNDRSRGGLPLCVPMFSVQQRPLPGCDLPLHGRLMYEPHTPAAWLATGDTWHRQHDFVATDNFAWDWSVDLALALGRSTLTYEVTVSRLLHCQNTHEMPFSLGFHPYFKTCGADFSFIINDKKTKKAEVPQNIADSDFAPYQADQPVRLTTSAGTVTLTASGYDEYCLWTDDIDSYFCIEPIYQYREFGLPDTGVQPGERRVFKTVLEFTPNAQG